MDCSAMIRAALLALLLTGCATAPKPPATYGNGDPGVIVNSQQYWVGNPSEAAKAAWSEEHLSPVIDEQEARALQWWVWGSSADIGTTIVGLTFCVAAVESNPLFAWMGPIAGPAANMGISYVVYKQYKNMAEATSRYQGSAISAFGGKVRTGVAVSNAILIARCI